MNNKEFETIKKRLEQVAADAKVRTKHLSNKDRAILLAEARKLLAEQGYEPLDRRPRKQYSRSITK